MDDIEIHQEGEYKIVNNYTTKTSTLFKNSGVLHQFTCGKKFDVWYKYYTVLFYDIILVRYFNYKTSELNNLSNLFHINKGLVFSEDAIWIDCWPWNDFIVIELEENKFGAIDKNLNWVVPPTHSSCEATDSFDGLPYLPFYKDDKEYQLLRNGVFFNLPSKDHYINDYSDEYIIIEEQNEDGFSRICFSEISEEIVNPKTFKTDFIYTNIVSDYHDDWITAECNGIEIWKHFTEWQALVCTPINRFDDTETNNI